MPLTAMHATAGVLDVTATVYGEDAVATAIGNVPWSSLHRARPRPTLRCRECEHGLHAKVSVAGLRFFAHDAGAPTCGLAGETLAHRLLKIELASAVRTAGWHAELEVPGNGWRADVLATSRDGTKRMAWEAQLASVTSAQLAERTAAMAADGVAVCWVTDKDRPFIGHVPSIRIAVDDDIDNDAAEGADDEFDNCSADAGSDSAAAARPDSRTYVVDGLGIFEQMWCEPWTRCPPTLLSHHRNPIDSCTGHGWWRRPEVRLTLAGFVAHVLHGSVFPNEVRTEPPLALGRHRPGNLLWTTGQHTHSEHQFCAATEDSLAVARERAARRVARQRRVDAELAELIARHARQRALTAPAVEMVHKKTGGYVSLRDSSFHWAMGLPLFVHDQPQAIISPACDQIQGAVRDRLAPLVIFVASSAERDELSEVCVPGQRIVPLDVAVRLPAGPFSAGGVSAREAFKFLLRRGRLH